MVRDARAWLVAVVLAGGCAASTAQAPVDEPEVTPAAAPVAPAPVAAEVSAPRGPLPPPPPPPPPFSLEPSSSPLAPAPANVAPTALESLRVTGEKNLLPDDMTKIELQQSGRTKIVAALKLCIDVEGSVARVQVLKSSGFPAYDALLETTVRDTWRYRPFLINGQAVPVCTAVTWIYQQRQPPPPTAP